MKVVIGYPNLKGNKIWIDANNFLNKKYVYFIKKLFKHLLSTMC